MSSSLALSTVPARPAPQTASAGGRLSAATALRWALAVALLRSTQYLIQPFVWKNWPVDEVLLGWVDVACHRVLVALSIAVALVLATRVPPRSLPARAGLLAAAIVAGAATGESALAFAGFSGARSDPSALFGGIVQWAGLASCAAGIHFLWLRSNRARAAARAQQLQWSTTEALRIQTQLQSLRYQIDPHFLFNTLATIRRLQETDSAEGARLLRHLLDYLRSAGRTPGQRTTLGDEIDLVRSYLAIVGTRMRERLTTVFDVPDDLRRHGCPPLSLATLAENAVKHGIGPAPDGGAIRVQARRHGETLEVCVEDTGVGLSQTAVGGAGIGLANIRARLRALYGDAASLTIAGNSPQGVRAVIRMPLEPRPRP